MGKPQNLSPLLTRATRTLGTDATPCWLARGKDPIERCNAYRALLDEGLSDDLLANIRLHLQQQRALGYDAFRAMVEAKTRRFARVRPGHRPLKPNIVD